MDIKGLIDKHDIPVVGYIDPIRDINAFAEYVSALEDVEGFVVTFNDGHRIKVKCDWYVRIHKALERIRYDRHIAALILNEELDDILPMLESESARTRVTEYNEYFMNLFHDKFVRLSNVVNTGIARYGSDKKSIALEYSKEVNKKDLQFVFKVVDGRDFRELFIEYLKSHLGTNTKYDELVKWMNT